MTTFSIADVRSFTADLVARMDYYDNGEGTERPTPGAVLLHLAQTCRDFRDKVREWKLAVFAGRQEYDAVIDRELQDAGKRLYDRAVEVSKSGVHFERSCTRLEGKTELQAALGDLDKLLGGWITPKLAVSPAPRRWSMADVDATEESRQKVASLPPLPEDWQPNDPERQARYRELKKS